MACIPFAELLPGHVIKVTNDSPPLIWAVDLVMAVTGSDKNHASETIRNLVKDNLFPESKFLVKSQAGRGNGRTRLVTFQDAVALILALPGNEACAIRQKASDIITRYLGGDTSLIEEIEANAESMEPINQMAQASLGDLGKRKLNNDTLEAAKLYMKAAHSTKLSAEEREMIKNSMLPYLNKGVPDSPGVIPAGIPTAPEAPTKYDPALIEYLKALIEKPDMPKCLPTSQIFEGCKAQAGKDFEMNIIGFGKQLSGIFKGKSFQIKGKTHYKLDRDDIRALLANLCINN